MPMFGGDASMLAQQAAQAAQAGRTRGEAVARARELRHRVMLELGRAREANVPLIEALRELVEDGVDIEFTGGVDIYPDETLVNDLIESIGVAYRQLERWVASLEGMDALTELMRNGPPGFVPMLLEAADGTRWWLTPDPDELMGALDGNVFSVELVRRECGVLGPLRRARRLVLTSDGHAWDMSRPDGFDQGRRALVQDGAALDVWLFEAPEDSPGDWALSYDGVDMEVADTQLADPAALRAWILEAHAVSDRVGRELGLAQNRDLSGGTGSR